MLKIPNRIVYIMSDNRSGSTLLDQLLGAHGEVVSVGEVHHLKSYALQDRSLYNPVHPLVCSCGDPVNNCRFWARVEERLGRPLAHVTLKARLFRKQPTPSRSLGNLLLYPRRFLVRHPNLYTSPLVAKLLDGPRIATESFALYDAIFDISGANYLVDSSKQAFRFRALYNQQPARMLLILLARDYRGTVHSKMKRGQGLVASTRGWVSRMREMEALSEMLPEQQVIRIKYEDLCCDPRATLARLCKFLNIEMSDEMLNRPSQDTHHLGGSPSKFDPLRTSIRLDESYRNAFSDDELSTMKEMVEDVARLWQYE